MRRAAREALPALSHYFGLHPWMLDDLSVAEYNVYMKALNKYPPVGWVYLGQPKK